MFVSIDRNMIVNKVLYSEQKSQDTSQDSNVRCESLEDGLMKNLRWHNECKKN